MTNAANLRFRVRFDKPSERDDGYGSTIGQWEPQFSRLCDIRPLKGAESVIAQRLQAIQPVLIIVRRDMDTREIRPSWHAIEILNGAEIRTYAVKTAEDMERAGQFITILAEAGAADA